MRWPALILAFFFFLPCHTVNAELLPLTSLEMPATPVIHTDLYACSSIKEATVHDALRQYRSRLMNRLTPIWPTGDSPVILASIASNGSLKYLQLLRSSSSLEKDKAIMENLGKQFPQETLA